MRLIRWPSLCHKLRGRSTLPTCYTTLMLTENLYHYGSTIVWSLFAREPEPATDSSPKCNRKRHITHSISKYFRGHSNPRPLGDESWSSDQTSGKEGRKRREGGEIGRKELEERERKGRQRKGRECKLCHTCRNPEYTTGS